MENGANTSINHNVMIKIIRDDPSIEETNLQRLPFSIGYNGFAKVSNYFKVTEKSVPTSTDNKKHLYSTFRGIQLIGEKIKIPNGFDGYIFRDENEQDTIDNNNRRWETISKFNELTYWNRETIPSDFDKQIQAFKSLNILSMVNKEVTKEDIENEIKSGKKNDVGNSNGNSTTAITTTNTTTTTITTCKISQKIINVEEEEEGEKKEKQNKEEKEKEVKKDNFKDDIDDTKEDQIKPKKSKK
ncbi:hypothetical protein ACTA71_007577 [Dictyostelium dimigraforme]